MRILHKLLLTGVLFTIGVFGYQAIKGDTTLEPLVRNDSNVKYFQTSDDIMIPSTYTEQDTEFRGVWVATVYNLNMPVHSSETQYKAAFQTLVNELLESNMNAMLFQVRPLNDAFYDSAYAPFSRYLAGIEGTDPGWDVLGYMIETCHANGIEFHAWMNPFRVANTILSQTDYINTLHAENFAKIHPELVVSGNLDSSNRNPLILNPGEPAVRQYIRNVVVEIMTNYDIDGIHFDDYFYPYSGISSDTATYDTYKEVGQTIQDWRRENVNLVVQGVKEDVDAFNTANSTDIRFGISPFGLWGSGIEGSSKTLPGGSNTATTNTSSYLNQYADSKKWVEEGWIHYICPQVYWTFTHTTAPYADVVDWWASIARGTGVDVLIGHAPSAADEGNWPVEDISDQLRYNQKHPEIKGNVMYSAAFLDHAHMQYVELNNWTVTPLNTWESNLSDISVSIEGILSGNVYIEDVSVTLSATDTIWYLLDDGIWTEYTTPIDVIGIGAHVLYMKTIDGLGTESSITSQNIPIQYFNPTIPTIEIIGNKIGSNYVLGSTINLSSTKDIYVAINHGSVGEYEIYTDPISLDDIGSYFIKAKTIDSRGVESEEITLSVTVQAECYANPVLNLTGTGNDPFFQNATATITSITQIQTKINDGLWVDYTGPLHFVTEGSFTLYYRNNDACQFQLARSFTIDTTPPSNATLEINGDYDGVKYYTSDTVVSLSSSEIDTTIRYRIHNGTSWSTWKNYTEAIPLLFTANFTLEYEVVDQAGNSSGTLSESIRLSLPFTEDNLYVVRDGVIVNYYNTGIPIELPTVYTEKTEEIRAIWVATVMNIDIALHTSETQYKAKIIEMLDTIEMNNFNTVFFQVRPMNDAFYDSSYAPFSRYLTGIEGVDPEWDVLKFIIEECHKRGLEFHAWLNPYRVSIDTDSKETQLNALHDENFAKQHPDLVMVDTAGKLILNPGERQVQVYIRNVIQELITRYDVDGIHFDDYFYSYNGTPLSEDSEVYNKTKLPGQSLEDWRRENINVVVREVYELIEAHNNTFQKTVLFGISPFGIWASGGEEGSNTSPYTMQSYKDQYADSKRWVEEGWVHYILPQLYWEFDHSSAPFADLVDWWAALTEANGVDLIIGHGFYRYDDDSWDADNELLEQLRYISQYDSVIGSSFFSYRTLNSLDKEVVQALERLNNYYWTEYATFTWESTVVKQVDPICSDDQTLIDGVCVDNPPVCETDQTLIDGTCVDNPPVCSDNQTLIDGACVDNEPVVTCDPGYERIDGGCVLIEEQSNLFKIIVVTTTSTVGLGVLLFILRKSIFKL